MGTVLGGKLGGKERQTSEKIMESGFFTADIFYGCSFLKTQLTFTAALFPDKGVSVIAGEWLASCSPGNVSVLITLSSLTLKCGI